MIAAARYDSPAARGLLDELAGHYVRAYGAHDLDADDPADYARPHAGCLVGYENGRPVAVSCWRRHEPGACELRRFYVAPAARGRGWSRRLLLAVLDAASAAGYQRAVCATAAPGCLTGAPGLDVHEIAGYGVHNRVPDVSCLEVRLESLALVG
ncbi:GNAT family N-acetyltransferase [Blastococcus sp. VKM Ac-2987]|uniref:GNAT family N-acetyltransferase n=1 Tax=Blastococcus sp. VKM Ac-2987 TaxID=3004141 RepID=UPI0022ABB1B0|nr:GNAT family N-acetyltransferase [Blastococcus sp. VKM Ac-2987]MCZ2857829.1 GNAT family N-acetyltransferase [Blastococcus sp. VKM Ac-2987]